MEAHIALITIPLVMAALLAALLAVRTARLVRTSTVTSETERGPLPVRILMAPGYEGMTPVYATPEAAGCDLRAAIPEPVTLRPGERMGVDTGVSIELPSGYEAQVRPRSGLALKHGIGMVNAPGTIDSDYRGRVFAILQNNGREPFVVAPGDRIAQMVIAPVTRAAFLSVAALSASGRGEGGFGSTGIRDVPAPKP